MAELTTIARPYAEAAFRIARDANALPVWSEMLRFLARRRRRSAGGGGARQSEAHRRATRRRCCCPSAASASTRRAAISSACWSTPIASRCCRRSATLFEALKNDADGVAKARIDSAFPLTDAQVGRAQGGARKAVRQEDRGDRQRRSGAGRRRADHRRRHGDRRHHRSAACGDGHPVAGLISKLSRAGGGTAGATRGHHAVESF